MRYFTTSPYLSLRKTPSPIAWYCILFLFHLLKFFIPTTIPIPIPIPNVKENQ